MKRGQRKSVPVAVVVVAIAAEVEEIVVEEVAVVAETGAIELGQDRARIACVTQ